MEILQLKYFMDTAKKENISHVAQTYRVPPSTVSVAIKKLEGELGFKLFDRTSNSLKLNTYGKIFCRAVEAAEKEIKKAKIDMLNLSATLTGEISLLILANRKLISDIIAKFKMDYPGVSFSIKHENHAENYNYKRFDIVISDRLIELNSFERKEFIQEEVFLAVHNHSALAALNAVSLEKIKNEKIICLPKGSSLRDFMDKCFKKADIEPEIAIECDDPYYIRKYLKIGLGVTFFPFVSWNNYIDNKIKLLRINDGMYRHSYIYLSKKSSEAAQIFVEMIESTLHTDFLDS